MTKELDIEKLQKILTSEWKGGVLSNWIDIIKKNFPSAEIINNCGSTKGIINGELYEFYEKRMYNDAPMIVKCKQ